MLWFNQKDSLPLGASASGVWWFNGQVFSAKVNATAFQQAIELYGPLR